MANQIFLRRGVEANIPALGVGEPGFAYDTGKFYIGSPTGNILVATVNGIQQGPAGPEGPEGPAGATGAQGPAGAPFQIQAVYADRATLEADSAPVHDSDGVTPFNLYEFALVNTGNVEDADNARLYMWNGVSFDFITDMSGTEGIQGPQGPAGADGAAGAQGPAGSDGLSAYQVAVNEGFVGTEAAWLASLVGADGADGADGAQGPQGLPGADGADGATGPAGADGADGVDGKTVLNGTAVPTTEGVDGDFYIKTDTNELYGPKTGGAWGAATSLVGPQGPAGADGADGATGATGPAGADGATGPAGADGADGVDGKTILNGTAVPTTEGVDGDFYLKTDTSDLYGPKTGGAWGAPVSLIGPQGPAGADGADGATGATGPAGADGADGDATAYTPATPGDWGSTVPTTIAQALDLLAANTTLP